MTDFGFDAFALDPLDAGDGAHPLEIARDLIASGKPRSALDVLADHHEALADDPEYLLLCAEAWRGDGDALRAQQALLGAARLAPDDPRPLWGLADIFSELGKADKATRIRAKAEALEARPSVHESVVPEQDDDLIAFAERRERSTQAALTPKQLLLAVLALGATGALIVGIARLTAPGEASSILSEDSPVDVEEPAAAALETGGLEDQPDAVELAPLPTIAAEPGPIAEDSPVDVEEAPAVEPSPIAEPRAAVEPPAPERRAPKKAATQKPARRKPKARAKPTPVKTAEVVPNNPDPKLVQRELASMSPAELTARADALEAEGHTGVAATYYRRALDLDADFAPALVGIGGSTLRAKKYTETAKTATRALELARGVDARPGLEAGAIYQLARVEYERGDRDAAKRLLRQSISLPHGPPSAWFYLGEILSSESSPAARQAYERYLELVPEGHLADRARRAIE